MSTAPCSVCGPVWRTSTQTFERSTVSSALLAPRTPEVRNDGHRTGQLPPVNQSIIRTMLVAYTGRRAAPPSWRCSRACGPGLRIARSSDGGSIVDPVAVTCLQLLLLPGVGARARRAIGVADRTRRPPLASLRPPWPCGPWLGACAPVGAVGPPTASRLRASVFFPAAVGLRYCSHSTAPRPGCRPCRCRSRASLCFSLCSCRVAVALAVRGVGAVPVGVRHRYDPPFTCRCRPL